MENLELEMNNEVELEVMDGTVVEEKGSNTLATVLITSAVTLAGVFAISKGKKMLAKRKAAKIKAELDKDLEEDLEEDEVLTGEVEN